MYGRKMVEEHNFNLWQQVSMPKIGKSLGEYSLHRESGSLPSDSWFPPHFTTDQFKFWIDGSNPSLDQSILSIHPLEVFLHLSVSRFLSRSLSQSRFPNTHNDMLCQSSLSSQLSRQVRLITMIQNTIEQKEKEDNHKAWFTFSLSTLLHFSVQCVQCVCVWGGPVTCPSEAQLLPSSGLAAEDLGSVKLSGAYVNFPYYNILSTSS